MHQILDIILQQLCYDKISFIVSVPELLLPSVRSVTRSGPGFAQDRCSTVLVGRRLASVSGVFGITKEVEKFLVRWVVVLRIEVEAVQVDRILRGIILEAIAAKPFWPQMLVPKLVPMGNL